MNFWVRNIVLGILLTALAWAFLANQDFLLSLDGSLGKVDKDDLSPALQAQEDKFKAISTTKAKAATPKTTNKAAIGLSKFYANLHGDMDGKGPKIRNNIVYLPEPKGDLVELLQAREMVVRPYNKNWHGSIESRPFRKGETLNQKLTEYSEKDGVELIWWLNRDYIIKDPFRIEKDILTTAYQVGKAIEGHFEEGLSIFFCYRQRAVVVVKTEPNDFLEEECTLLGSKADY